MIILPASASADGSARACEMLRQISEQRRKVTLLVFGDTDVAREVASRADVRADDHPARQVIWCPDPAVFHECGVEKVQTLAGQLEGGLAVAMTLRFELSTRLDLPEARSFIELERAFASALAGELLGDGA